MAHENIIFAIIVVIVVIVLLLIFLRIWEIIKPYVVLARKIIRVVDIIKNFTIDVALTLLGLIREVVTDIFKVFKFDDTTVLAFNNISQKIDNVIDNDIIEELITEGKRVVITAIGKSSKQAVKIANQLAEKLVPVSLVLFDGLEDLDINEKIHTINIDSKELNVSAVGTDSETDSYVSKSINGSTNYNIIKPDTMDVNGYMEAVKKGFI